RIALSYEDGKMTYRQLNQKSNQVAHMLMANGLQKGDYLAIIMDRSKETIISLLGVLKAGGVYVPIDPSYPKERCQYLLHDT
ncbi:AMP-binding protein, partial [Lysinibacillus sp. D4A3_S15]|uniref:AMP-binding protein n=1 Tax=Lysinibacillus sp. D4A3_S15 TaxID=2941227 RepID=UPI0020BF0B84